MTNKRAGFVENFTGDVGHLKNLENSLQDLKEGDCFNITNGAVMVKAILIKKLADRCKIVSFTTRGGIAEMWVKI